MTTQEAGKAISSLDIQENTSAFLSMIDECKLTRNEIRLALKLIQKVQSGCLIRISWASFGESLGIKRNNMPRHIKALKEAQILIEDDGGNVFLNPQIIAKGKILGGKKKK